MSTFVDDSVELRPNLKSHPENTKNTKFLINFDAQKSTQLFEIRTKNPKIDKFLNHVFKTSKKTLSYSRTYCKIYKIENIGKIGQSRAGLKAKRVIYYGSTRSTLSTPLSSNYPPHFYRWISKSGKKWNYHFWGFLSQKPQNTTFWRKVSNFDPENGHFLVPPPSKLSKIVNFDNFHNFALIFLDEILTSVSRNIRITQGGSENTLKKWYFTKNRKFTRLK